MLKFIDIVQFNQMDLIFKINVTKEIKEMLARNFNETLMCSIWCIFVSAQIFKASCNHLHSCDHPTHIWNWPGSRPQVFKIEMLVSKYHNVHIKIAVTHR